MTRYEILVHGSVQGVGFRYFTALKAMQCNLYGFCRNLDNGNVKIEVQGDESNILTFISLIRKGNNFCKIVNIDIRTIPLVENCKKYKIY